MSELRSEKSSASKRDGAPGIKDRMVKNWQLIFILSLIVIIAFILRSFFAYDYAVTGGFALSGGSGASQHLRSIEHIMTNWGQLTSDPGLNFPFGDHNLNPFLMDWMLAVAAKIVTLFGVSSSAAAAGTLVFSTAILGALTCIPIYCLGKEMFSRNAGLIAALLYGICAAVISNTVLSNGTEAAFYGFFFVLTVYFLYKAVKACANETSVRDKEKMSSLFARNRQALKYALIAGIMLACVALTWNGFRPVVLMLVAVMIIQVVLDRIRKKDPTAAASVYSLTLMVGMFIAAPFYLFQGLWGMVFSGPFMLSIIAVLVTLLLCATKRRPWLVSIPTVAIVTLLFFVILFFISPGAFSDIVSGNALYTDPTYASLVGMNSVVSLSQMAGYYGWFTMWLPYVLAALMIYAMREKMGSPTHVFILVWIVAMLAIGWTSRANVFLAAPAYAVGGGAILAKIFSRVDVKEYFANFKGTGFHIKTGLKKIFRPIPLFTVLMAVFLVGAPNAIYAIDSGVSSNQKSSGDTNSYFGAFNYFVRNDDSWKANDAWNSMSGKDKSGALVTWWDYSNDAARMGGFDVITGTGGAGAAAASNILLANGSKEATAAMAIRLVDYYGADAFYTEFVPAFMDDDQFAHLKSILDDPSSFIIDIMRNPDRYGEFSSSLTPENAMYIMAIYYLCATPPDPAPPATAEVPLGLSEKQIIDLYDAVCGVTGNSINYIAVSPSMFPIGYGDGSMFSTLAYMNNYILDVNGAPRQFYYYDYSGYCVYNDNMYDSVLWRTYVGPSPDEYGYSSGIQMLSAFTSSNGEPYTYPQPGFGMPNYQVVYWKVLYNPDPEATYDSDGWETMDALEARELQMQESDPAKRGLINYLAGYPIIIEYLPSNGADLISGTVDDGTDPVSGARVTLFDQDGLQRTTVFTDDSGYYEMYVPYASGKITVSLGTYAMVGGIEIEDQTVEFDPLNPLPASPIDFMVPVINFEFRLFEDSTYATQMVDPALNATIKGEVHGQEVNVAIAAGTFSPAPLIPDLFTVTIKDGDATIFVGTYYPNIDWATQGDTVKADMFLSTATIILNIKNEFGAPLVSDPIPDPPVAGWYEKHIKLTNLDDPAYYRIAELDENGNAEVDVIPGTYAATVVAWDGVDETTYADDPDYELFNAFVTVSARGTQTLSATAQGYATLTLDTAALAGTILTEVRVLNSAISISVPDPALDVKVPAGSALITYTVYASYIDGSDRMFSYATADVTRGSSVTCILPAGFGVFDFSRTLVSPSGSPTAGTVDIYSGGDLLMTLGAGSDGVIRTSLPAGTYTIHAYNATTTNRLAHIGELTIMGTDTGGQIPLERANALTAKVLMSNDGAVAIPFVPIEISESIRGISFNVTTDAAGLYSKAVPMNGNYTFTTLKNIGTYVISNDDSAFVSPTYVKGLTVTTTNTVSVTFRTVTPTLSGAIFFEDQNGNAVVTEGLIAGVSGIIEIKLATQADTQYIRYNTDAAGRLLDLGGNPVNLPIGDYTVRIQRDIETSSGARVPTGYYYTGTLKVGSDPSDITVTVNAMNRLELVGLGAEDLVTVTKLDGGDMVAGTGTTAKHENIWYFEAGKTFQVKVTDAAEKKVWYYYVTDNTVEPAWINAEPGLFGTRVNVELEESIEIKGYVGYAGTGKLYISYGQIGPYASGSYMHDLANPEYITDDSQTYVATLSGGMYTAVLPKAVNSLEDHMYFFAAFTNYDYEDEAYIYTNMPGYLAGDPAYPVRGDPTRIVDTGEELPDPRYGVVNMTMVGGPAQTPDDITFIVTETGWAATFADDEFEATFEVTMTLDPSANVSMIDFRSFFLSGGMGWDTITFYSDAAMANEIFFINGDAAGMTFYVKATFKQDVTGSQLTIYFRDAAGAYVYTHTVEGDSALIVTDATNDVVIGKGESDRISNSESSLSITLRNNTLFAKTFLVSVLDAVPGSPDELNDEWYYVISDSNGRILSRNGEHIFDIGPMTDMTVYIKIIGMTENSPKLPDDFEVSVTVFEDDAATAPWDTVTPGDEAAAGASNEIIVTISPQPVDLTSGSGSATGPNVFNDGGSVPSILWIMVAVMLLLLILIVWLGTKRGVFSRRK